MACSFRPLRTLQRFWDWSMGALWIDASLMVLLRGGGLLVTLLQDHFLLFLFIYSQTKTWIMSHRRLPDHFWTFRSLPDHFWPFRASQTIYHFWPLKPFLAVSVYLLPDHFWLFETSQTISGFKSLPDHFCPFRHLNNTKNKLLS